MKLIFSHGKESGPFGRKIVALTRVALARGVYVQSLDYTGIACPQARAERLIEVLEPSSEPHLLVGSSMGAHVSLLASQAVPVAGLFLLAPVLGLPGYALPPRLALAGVPVTIIHSWDDAVVPVGPVVDFAKAHRAELHLVDSDHRLQSAMSFVTAQFDHWLGRLAAHRPPLGDGAVMCGAGQASRSGGGTRQQALSERPRPAPALHEASAAGE